MTHLLVGYKQTSIWWNQQSQQDSLVLLAAVGLGVGELPSADMPL